MDWFLQPTFAQSMGPKSWYFGILAQEGCPCACLLRVLGPQLRRSSQVMKIVGDAHEDLQQ